MHLKSAKVMHKEEKKWRSPSLGKDMKLNIYGTSGTPVLAFPTRGQKRTQWEEHGMIDALSLQLDNGFNRLYCVDSVDEEGFLNEHVEPAKRLMRHRQFESYIIEEVVPFIHDDNPIKFIMAAGIDLGGYHAVNLALKHPSKFGKAIGIRGVYDIKQFMNGYYDDDVYYNNPVDFMPNLNRKDLLFSIREVDFRLVSHAEDSRKDETFMMAEILRLKFVEHKLDIWDLQNQKEWSLWQQMIRTHII
jgi:esterase/lipase superfamily enzyme